MKRTIPAAVPRRRRRAPFLAECTSRADRKCHPFPPPSHRITVMSASSTNTGNGREVDSVSGQWTSETGKPRRGQPRQLVPNRTLSTFTFHLFRRHAVPAVRTAAPAAHGSPERATKCVNAAAKSCKARARPRPRSTQVRVHENG